MTWEIGILLASITVPFTAGFVAVCWRDIRLAAIGHTRWELERRIRAEEEGRKHQEEVAARKGRAN